jgi:hypothetical protein
MGELWLRQSRKMRTTLETLSSKSTKSTKRTLNLYFETRDQPARSHAKTRSPSRTSKTSTAFTRAQTME